MWPRVADMFILSMVLVKYDETGHQFKYNKLFNNV